jgi:hypothetical protein
MGPCTFGAMTNTEEPRPGSWAAVDRDSQRFRDLLAKYDEDYQQATDAYLRCEEAPSVGGSDNSM